MASALRDQRSCASAARVTGGCEPHDVGVGIELGFLQEQYTHALNSSAVLPAQDFDGCEVLEFLRREGPVSDQMAWSFC